MLDKSKRYLVVGLGLLGGKYALELSKAGFHVDGINRSEGHLQYALDHGYIASGKTHDFEDLVSQADHIIFGLYPTALIDWFRTYGSLLKPGCIFTDVSGVKTGLVEPVQAMCPAGVEFIASHPMAGRERGGFTSATDSLYVGASMILTPDKRTDMQLLERLKVFFLDIGFASLTFSDPEEHDRIIAFTSQLAHIVSSAYVKSPEAQKRRGFSAGSFQDMTRVARLDEDMWTELFLDDADYLTDELDILIGHLQEYADALKSKDAEHLRALLRDGREKKATAGGN